MDANDGDKESHLNGVAPPSDPTIPKLNGSDGIADVPVVAQEILTENGVQQSPPLTNGNHEPEKPSAPDLVVKNSIQVMNATLGDSETPASDGTAENSVVVQDANTPPQAPVVSHGVHQVADSSSLEHTQEAYAANGTALVSLELSGAGDANPAADSSPIDCEETTPAGALSQKPAVAHGNHDASEQPAQQVVNMSSMQEATGGAIGSLEAEITVNTGDIPMDCESAPPNAVVDVEMVEADGHVINATLSEASGQEPSSQANSVKISIGGVVQRSSEMPTALAPETVANGIIDSSVTSESKDTVQSGTTNVAPGLPVVDQEGSVTPIVTAAAPQGTATVNQTVQERVIPEDVIDDPMNSTSGTVHRNFTPPAPLLNGFDIRSSSLSQRRERKRAGSPYPAAASSAPSRKATYIDSDYALALRLQEEENRKARSYSSSRHNDHDYASSSYPRRRRTSSSEPGPSRSGPSSGGPPIEVYPEEPSSRGPSMGSSSRGPPIGMLTGAPMRPSSRRAMAEIPSLRTQMNTSRQTPRDASRPRVPEQPARRNVPYHSPASSDTEPEVDEQPMSVIIRKQMHDQYWECTQKGLGVLAPYLLHRVSEAGYVQGYTRSLQDRLFFENEEQLLEAMVPPEDPTVERKGELHEKDDPKNEICNEMWRQYTYCVKNRIQVPTPFSIDDMTPFEYTKLYLIAGATGENISTKTDEELAAEIALEEAEAIIELEEKNNKYELVVDIPSNDDGAAEAQRTPPHRRTAAQRKAAYQAAAKTRRLSSREPDRDESVEDLTAIRNIMLAAARRNCNTTPEYVPTQPRRRVSRRQVEEEGEPGPTSRRLQGLPDYDDYIEDELEDAAALGSESAVFAIPAVPRQSGRSARINTSPVAGRFSRVSLFDINRKKPPGTRSPSRECYSSYVERLAIPLSGPLSPPRDSFPRKSNAIYNDKMVKKHPFLNNIDKNALEMMDHASGGSNVVSSTTNVEPAYTGMRWLDPENMPRVPEIPKEEIRKMPQEYIDEINKAHAIKDAMALLPPPPPRRIDRFSIAADKEEAEEKELFETSYLDLVRSFIPCNVTIPPAIFNTRFEVFIRFPFLERPLYIQNVLTALGVPDNGGNVRMELHPDYQMRSVAECMKIGVQARMGLLFQGEDLDNLTNRTITHDEVLDAGIEFRKTVNWRLEVNADQQPIEGEQRVLAHSLIAPYIALLRLYPLSKEDIAEMHIQRRDYLEEQERRMKRERIQEARRKREIARTLQCRSRSRSPRGGIRSLSRTRITRSRARRSPSRSPETIRCYPAEEVQEYERVDIDSDTASLGSTDLGCLSDEDLATALRLSEEMMDESSEVRHLDDVPPRDESSEDQQ